MSRFKTLPLGFAIAFLLATGCGNDTLRYRYGFDLNQLEFNLYTADMGVHPDTSVLDDPNNPFRWEPLGIETKWTIETYGRVVPRVYVWATALAIEPIGENQLYAAQALEDLFRQELTQEAYLPFVRSMAVRAYQSVLDNFPDSVSYLADGVTSFPLNIIAYDALVGMGETPAGGWTVLLNEDGDRVLIQVEQ